MTNVNLSLRINLSVDSKWLIDLALFWIKLININNNYRDKNDLVYEE